MISLKDYMSKRNRHRRLGLVFAMILLFLMGVGVEFSLGRIVAGLPDMADLFRRMAHPNFSYMGEVLEKIMETLEIAILSSMTGVMLAIPVSLLTAENISPNRYVSKMLNGVFAFFRTIPSLIWAALLVSVFSIGKFSGTLALAIIAFLMALKLFREYIESINENQLNSTRSVGASSLEVLRYCVLPNMLGMAVSVFFIVFETNIRSATVLGLVGAGGIGQMMWRDLNHLRYDNLATIILMLFATILFIDLLSYQMRKFLQEYSPAYKNLQHYRLHQIFKSVLIPALMTVMMVGIINSLNISLERLAVGYGQGRQMVLRMLQVDFSYYPKLLEGIFESFLIAVFATITGGLLAILFSYFAAGNLSPGKLTSLAMKGLINIMRTFPPIIMAIIFFRGVGPGPLAGALALSIYTTGVLTKMYSEVLENMQGNVKESVLVTGATRFEAYRHGVFPQTFPHFTSLLLYRMESNIRNATVLGIIGAGGIGTALTMNINWRNWERVGLLLLGVSVMIILIDRLSNHIRQKVK
ncbi:phosphonate ABC transporter, permease protein PhnE [Anoxynatronum buryatiense]|uniref:Phosphonate transport system permease protein n=1 Tax=Anoxynatronum buryatiense TaxID=489973 RepID=A0AA45WV83_9CLOT|nr:phosphonate ABC transporter, permease protein PhnE [Anoxynatronum buryatiense]SMP50846.1 phosphonate transport system permease protein [Anoxynatronum buryatiense]